MPRTTTKSTTKKATSVKTPVTPRRKKAVQPPKATYRTARYGNVKYRSASALVKYLLKNTKMPQVKIARKCNVTEACVSQLAREYR